VQSEIDSRTPAYALQLTLFRRGGERHILLTFPPYLMPTLFTLSPLISPVYTYPVLPFYLIVLLHSMIRVNVGGCTTIVPLCF